MKKIQKSARRFVFLCLGMLAGVYTYAQDKADSLLPESAYHVDLSKHTSRFGNVNITAVIFGIIIALGIYAIFHFVANGAIVDDMSEKPHHQ